MARATFGGMLRVAPLLLLAGLSACNSFESAQRNLDLAAREAVAESAPLAVTVLSILGEDSAQLTLTWPEPVAVRSTSNSRALLLRFGRTFTAPEMESIPRRLKGWVESVHLGPDSILIRTARDVDFWVAVDGPVVTLDLVPRAPDPGETVIIGGTN